MLWVVSIVLLILWAGGLLFHKGGLLHILLLIAIALIVVELVAKRRATY